MSEAVVVSMMRVVLAALSLAMASCQDFGSVQEMMESNVETFRMAGVAGGVFHGLFGWLTRCAEVCLGMVQHGTKSNFMV